MTIFLEILEPTAEWDLRLSVPNILLTSLFMFHWTFNLK